MPAKKQPVLPPPPVSDMPSETDTHVKAVVEAHNAVCADKVFKNVVDLEPRKIDAKLGEHSGTKVPYQIHLPYMHICFLLWCVHLFCQTHNFCNFVGKDFTRIRFQLMLLLLLPRLLLLWVRLRFWLCLW